MYWHRRNSICFEDDTEQFLDKKWESFYTDSLIEEDDFYISDKPREYLVDQLVIDEERNIYILELNQPLAIIKDGNDIFSAYVSRFVFDGLLTILEQNNFKRCDVRDEELYDAD